MVSRVDKCANANAFDKQYVVYDFSISNIYMGSMSGAKFLGGVGAMCSSS